MPPSYAILPAMQGNPVNQAAARLLLPLLLLLLAGPAGGGVYFLPGRGVRAMGRAGAAVVSSDDAMANWYNPARLALQSGTRLQLGAGMTMPQMHFQRYPMAEVDETFAAVDNQAPPAPSIGLGISSDFGLEQLVLGLAFYTPAATWNRYPEQGPQRYAEVRSDNLAFSLQFSAAWRPLSRLSLGAGLRLFTLRINHTYAISAFPGIFGMPEDRDLDALVQNIAEDLMEPSAVVGLWFDLGTLADFLEGFELGAAFVSGVSVAAGGHLNVRLPENVYYDNVTLDPEQPPVRVELDFPWMVRWGLRWRYRELFDVECDVAWEGWSVTDEVRDILTEPTYYHDLPTIGDYLLSSTASPRHFRDTWSVRLGGQYRALDWLLLRLGFLWESGAVPDAYLSVANPDSDKFGLGLGVGVELGAFQFDLGYLHLFQLGRDVAVGESLVTQTNPSNPEGSTYVGAGSYRSGYDLLGLAVLVQLDEFWR
ncbi:MAG: hypothetical protein DRI34_00905 [Deltaproteobacteria bacterium]|nr:MAG: hypothetical protein DRI34_00905 [Deltaproteobacteria bacterium]